MGEVLTAIPEWFKVALRDYLATWRQTVTEHVPRAYWDTLSDCERGDIEAAGLELRRFAGGEFPPSASTWHQAARRMTQDRARDWICRHEPFCGNRIACGIVSARRQVSNQERAL